MRRKARRVTQADFLTQGRAFVADCVRDLAMLEQSNRDTAQELAQEVAKKENRASPALE